MIDLDHMPAAVKWAALVLATGFVAQFGKMLAEYVVKRYRERHASSNTPQAARPSGETTGGAERRAESAPFEGAAVPPVDSKIEKKMRKARYKANKKSRDR
ncbi:MAG TPA: hypothetical protein PKM65_11685 [Spirochaetota bacterium]|nr:hypothetical protein [Spirochaetota bacterium]HNT09459.1 hypothetical protein [Spirochaetota bacterium]